MVEMGSTDTLIQAMVPDHYRGRMAVYSMMFMGMAPFGALMAGASRFMGVRGGGAWCSSPRALRYRTARGSAAAHQAQGDGRAESERFMNRGHVTRRAEKSGALHVGG